MTRPIYEPNLERTDAYLDFGQQQLFRRPAPVSTTDIPRFSARRITSFQSIASGSEVDLTWNDWDNGDDAVYDTVLSGGLLRSVTLLQAGVYSFYVVISIQDLASGSIAIVMNDGYDNPTCVVHPAYNFGNGADYLLQTVQTFEPFQPDSNPPGVGSISFDLAQNSGVSRNTRYGTYLEICYFGPYISNSGS